MTSALQNTLKKARREGDRERERKDRAREKVR